MLELIVAVGILGKERNNIAVECGMSCGKGVLVLGGELDGLISVPVGLVHVAWVTGGLPLESVDHFLETLCLLVAAFGLKSVILDMFKE